MRNILDTHEGDLPHLQPLHGAEADDSDGVDDMPVSLGGGSVAVDGCVTSTGTPNAAKAGTKRPMHGASKPKTATQSNRGEKQASGST